MSVPLEQACLDELRQKRCGREARPADLIEPVGQECRSGGRLPRAIRSATRACRASGSPSRPTRSCSASSYRPWSTRISARRADGGMQRERWPAAVIRSPPARVRIRRRRCVRSPHTSAQHVLQKPSSVTWSCARTKSSRTALHCCGRSLSCSLAREHERAADIRERLQGGRLATCHCRGLVEPGQAARSRPSTPRGRAARALGVRDRCRRGQCDVESS